MLLLGIFIIICFLMVAALAIDMGHVYVARQQMQTAANTAVVEVVRKGDGYDAQRFVEAMFDDDFGLSDENSIQYGAGGEVTYYNDHGIVFPGGFDPSARYYLPDSPDRPADRDPVRIHKPSLALNLGHDPRGDIVRGTYVYSDNMHREDDDYVRSDFRPSGTGDGSAALVRLRRTGEEFDPPGTDPPEISAAGPTVPFLFGRGNLSVGNEDGNGDFWKFIDEGVRVRATAIADLSPAISAGREYLYPTDLSEPGNDIIGLSQQNGLLALRRSGDTDIDSDIDFANPLYFNLQDQVTIGTTLATSAMPVPTSPPDGTYIAAVVSDTSDVVYGFAVVDWIQSTETATLATPTSAMIINATGVFVDSSNLSQLTEIIDWHNDLRPEPNAPPPAAWPQLLKVPVRRQAY